MNMSGEPLWKRALQQPENVKKVLQMLATSGVWRTKSMVQGKLAAGVATGYSLPAGMVIAVGEGVTDFQKGDRVACAGAQYAIVQKLFVFRQTYAFRFLLLLAPSKLQQ